MIRWVRQRSSIACGPTAVINVSKWLAQAPHDMSLASSDEDFIASLCHTNRRVGTDEADLDRVLRVLFSDELVITHRVRPKASLVRQHLSRDKTCAIIMYHTPGHDSHYYLMMDDGRPEYLCINDDIKHTITRLKRFKLGVRLRRRHNTGKYAEFSHVWLLRHR